jgi:ABC-type branched-subunit amino acid transport system ATPase component
VNGADLLVVRDLKRSFGGVRAVDGVSFRVSRGSITGLIGPNGAGKSTALDVIAGAPADAGTVEFDGSDVTALAPMRRARRGLIRTFQTSSEFQRLTVIENLLVAAKDHPGETLRGALVLGRHSWRHHERTLVDRARELMAQFQMSDKEDEWAGNLSGGQKRLLEIMRGLMADPELLLLDEPMAGVNPTLARIIEGHLERLGSEGLTMLMVEHELAVVERLCEHVLVMAQGRIISEGTMENVRTDREVLDAYLVG